MNRSRLILATLFIMKGVAISYSEIVYTSLTAPIELGDEYMTEYEPIDVNLDGVFNFTFAADAVSSVGLREEAGSRCLIISSPPPDIGGQVAALTGGFEIGSDSGDGGLDWFGLNTGYDTLMRQLSSGRSGQFWGTRAYIGIEFEAADGIHYGWLDVQGHSGVPYAQVHGWAYENEPNTPIIAGAVPEPSSMILFIIGMTGIWTMRRRKNR